MSKYTVEVRNICETYSGYCCPQGYLKTNEIIKNALPYIFDFDFPIFDEDYRKLLETKIIKHFYTREIGFETVGLWKLKLDTTLNEIMPKYNKMYAFLNENAERLFYNTDITESGNRKNNTNNKTKGTVKDDSRSNVDETRTNMYSDTPQSRMDALNEPTYLTTLSKDTGNNKGVSNSTTVTDANSDINSLDEYINRHFGYTGSSTNFEMLMKYHSTMQDIDMMIINDLECLFMLLW